jgi:hypothetical protein
MELLAYLHMQMRLEGNEIVDKCFIRQVEVVPDEEVPLMLIAELADQKLVAYYDEAISPDLQKDLATSFHEAVFPNIEPLLDILKAHGVKFGVGHYKTYVVSSMAGNDGQVSCLSRHDSNVKDFGFDGFAEHVYAIEHNGRILSACVSTRENKTCGEAWVFTLPEYRNQGLAQNVVNAWAGSMKEAGKVPFYSHKIENEASANLAKRLRLQPVFEEIAISQIK